MKKKNSKHVGRALAKVAHSNPLVIFRVILTQVESYDNMINPIIESLGFMTPLALDVLSYMLPVHLADTSRRRLQGDGMNIAHWFQHLAQFVGVFYRAFPQTELRALIDFLMQRLELGDSLYLLVLNELLSRMGGCEVLEDISDAQIGSLAGGDTLRHEMLAFDKASKRAVNKLQDILCTSDTAIPILALIAQQRGYALFKGQVNHVKLLGQLFDRCQLVLVQLVDFLSGSPEHPPPGGEKLAYYDLLPDLAQLSALHVQPQIALHAARPLIAKAARHRQNKMVTRSLPAPDLPTCLSKWEPSSATLRASLPMGDSNAMTSELYLTFWSLSLYDIKLPVQQYDAQIALIRAKLSAAQRESLEPDKRKKEMARCLNTVNLLVSELEAQKRHCKQITSDLEARREGLLGSIVEDHRRSISDALLQNCIMPRVTTTPEDSLFCAIFFEQLHVLETSNFSSLQYYDRVVKDVFPVIYCATDHEARCLGIFLRATFEPLKRWRFDKRAYEMEAASKPGFSVAIGSAARCSYDQYCTVFLKWYDKITKLAIHCLSHYRDHGRACLLVLIKLVGVYPVRKRICAQLLDLLDVIKVQADMKDIQAMARRYHTLLNRSELSFDEISSKREAPPQSKRQVGSTIKF